MKMRLTLKDYFVAKLLRDISENMRYIYCHHKFAKHGLGYRCLGCDFYTGTNDALNKHIKKNKIF